MSSFGKLFRISTFGESHCKGVGVIIDGCPPRMALSTEDIQPQLTRRRPGQSKLSTARNEADSVHIFSGVELGRTLGTPICLFVANKDHRPGDYSGLKDIPRPSHADYTYQAKYGIRASSGGGRSSARETIGTVASGAIAEKWLREHCGVSITAWVSGVGGVSAPRELESAGVTREEVDRFLVRCPHEETAREMTTLIENAKADKDSLGGVVTCVCTNVPLGIGEPVFDKLEAMLAHAMLSIPATKGFEVGSGFEGARLRGSTHNDAFIRGAEGDGALRTMTNNSGGIQGGISNGEPIIFRVAFKPAATIGQEQQTVDFSGNESVLAAKGRHDPCVLPRAVPIVECMAALVLMDATLCQLQRQHASSMYPSVGRVRPEEAEWGTQQKEKKEGDDTISGKIEASDETNVKD
eukprot:205075_1